MRLFISVQFTEPMINALEAFQSRLKASSVEGYFAVRENLHLTLAFIGDYGAPDEVMDVIEAVPFEPMTMKLNGMGNFGDLYWAGIEENIGLDKLSGGCTGLLLSKKFPMTASGSLRILQ